MSKKTLRDRCREFLSEAQRSAIMRQGDPVRDLEAFVLAEQGRAADAAFEDMLPLVLYFGDDADRDEFIALIRAAKPGWRTKKMP